MIIKINPDKEKVKSILMIVEQREKFIFATEIEQFPTIIAESYYEIIKELSMALLSLDGLKTIGENAHKEIIDELLKYREFSEDEIGTIQDLRIKRNKSMYEGRPIEKIYLENKGNKLGKIIEKLKKIIADRINK